MKYASFSLMEKTINLDRIEGKFAAFAKAFYAIPVRLSKPIAEDGHGIAAVNGIPVSRGVTFHMDMIVSMDVLMVSVGEAAWEYGREYTLTLTGYRAADGTPFRDTTLKFKTLPRQNDHDPKYAQHDQIALQAAREGMVLLKNEEKLLPLKQDARINVFGAGQHMFRNTATGAGLINPRWQANFHQSIAEHSRFQVNTHVSQLYRGLKDISLTDDQLAQAREFSDTALLIITRASGEFLDNKPDRGGYYLTDEEAALARQIAGQFPRRVAIINSGYPMDLKWAEELGFQSVLYTGFCGMAAGYALMDILDGRTNPSGRLPDTWALDYYDHPSAHNFPNFKAEEKLPGEKDYAVELYYEEDIYVGYRYFDTFGKPVLYPFGHGLSYTSFSHRGKSSWDGTQVTAQVTVTNTGSVSGKETVLLYVQAPEGSLEKPRKVLAGFEKTRDLAPGQVETLTVRCPGSYFASFDEGCHAYILEPGTYQVLCGEQRIGSFVIEQERILRSTLPVNVPVEPFHKLTQADPTIHGLSRNLPLEERIAAKAPRPVHRPDLIPSYTGRKITFPQLKEDPNLLECFIGQLTDAELCRLNVGGGANWYMPWDDGSACKNNTVSRLKMPVIKVSDGNTGLNLKKTNIGFPSSAAIAASFNKELAYQVGKTIGDESKEHGIAVNLGPAANLHRNILNGRQPEYFSEDPVHAGILAAMHARGLEDAGVGATYKHLFCNGSDTCRKASHSIVSERALRELYFKVFDVAMGIHRPACVMTSYNAVNGIYPAENADILQKLLRQEWGFDGFIMTDWGTYDTVDPAEMAQAGNCWLTEGSSRHVKQLQAAVKEGRLSRANLQDNAKYLLKWLLRFA